MKSYCHKLLLQDTKSCNAYTLVVTIVYYSYHALLNAPKPCFNVLEDHLVLIVLQVGRVIIASPLVDEGIHQIPGELRNSAVQRASKHEYPTRLKGDSTSNDGQNVEKLEAHSVSWRILE